MLRIMIFNCFYVGTCAFVFARGGRPERLAMIILILDFQVSHWVIKPIMSRYNGVEGAMLAVDVLACAALYALSRGRHAIGRCGWQRFRAA